MKRKFFRVSRASAARRFSARSKWQLKSPRMMALGDRELVKSQTVVRSGMKLAWSLGGRYTRATVKVVEGEE